MNRLHQFVLIASTMLGSWLGMQAIHEMGHVLGAWLTGGKVAAVILHPMTISRTDLDHNPRPLVVVWAGPVVGVVAPLMLWLAAFALQSSLAFLYRFFAGFCLLANGLYIGVGSFDGVGDCGEMLRHGSDPWELWLFGATAALYGVWLWHGQGTHFGFGSAKGHVSQTASHVSLLVCAVLLIMAVWVGGQ